MFELSHVSLVTGASGGIGAAAAIELAARGSSVAIHYHQNAEGAERVCERVLKHGVRAFLFQADLDSREGAQRLVEQVLGHFGQIHTLVNNAGSMIGRRLLADITEDFWKDCVDTNIGSVLWVTQAVAASMILERRGSIINIASVAARNGGSPGVLAYAAAKAAVLCMTKSMAKELIASGVRVNGVNPGVIDTPFHTRFTGEERFRSLVAAIPQGRPGTPEEVAKTVAFLASEDAAHIVGETIEVNGGIWMD